MNILVLSQTYYPDTVATAQLLSDLCLELDKKGHTITVVTSKYSYENKKIKYAKTETQGKNIQIKRLNDTGFGKNNVLARILDFASYICLSIWFLLFLKPKKYDVVIGMTSPPLISFFIAAFKKWKKYKLFYWTMDLQPELAIESGLIKKGGIVAKFFTFLGNYTFKKADKIGVLDVYMKNYCISRGVSEKNIEIVTLWSVLMDEYTGTRAENPFRVEKAFGEKIVVMYSGNHSYVHSLDTLLQAILQLQHDERFLFVFVGGGVRKQDVTNFKEKHNLQNIVQYPYQPRNYIHISLAASDFQVVIMGEGQVGYTHPNKIYGALFVGKPILYVGPAKSHVTDILETSAGNILVRHNDSQGIVNQLKPYADNLNKAQEVGKKNKEYALKYFEPQLLKNKIVEFIERI